MVPRGADGRGGGCYPRQSGDSKGGVLERIATNGCQCCSADCFWPMDTSLGSPEPHSRARWTILIRRELREGFFRALASIRPAACRVVWMLECAEFYGGQELYPLMKQLLVTGL